MSISIVIADDHPIFLIGLRDLVNDEPDLTVVATVNSGEDAITAMQSTDADLLISDISMKGIGGIEAARRIRAERPEIKILMLSLHAERNYVLAAIEAGANGYLLKEAACDDLITAVHTLLNNQSYISPAVAGHVLDACTGDFHDKDKLSQLTAREREVLCLIATGKTTKQIATHLEISPKTVSTHREHLMTKLDTHSIATLTRFAIHKGLIHDGDFNV